MTNNNKCKKILVSLYDLKQLFEIACQPHISKVTILDWPPDVQLVGAVGDWDPRGVWMIFYHPSWPALRDRDAIPVAGIDFKYEVTPLPRYCAECQAELP